MGFRGIEPEGLYRLADELADHAATVSRVGRVATALLDQHAGPNNSGFAGRVEAVVSWAELTAGNMRWRAAAIRTGQALNYGCGVPDIAVDEIREKAMLAAFVPSHVDMEQAYEEWLVVRAALRGRALGNSYLTGNNVSEDLAELRNHPHYASVAAAFFNTIGDEATAYLPQNVMVDAWKGSLHADEAAAQMRSYAEAFAAATRGGRLEFTVADLFRREDPLAQINDQYAAALLFTARGIDPAWLTAAAEQVVTGEPFITWITMPQVVEAVLTGLCNNPAVAGAVVVAPGAAAHLLRRSTLLSEHGSHLVGEALLAAATGAGDRATAAAAARAIVAALGSGEIHPQTAVLPYVATVGGHYVDDLAWSLVSWGEDPTYDPKFVVTREEARLFLLETMRATEAYAITLAAAQAWITTVVGATGETTHADYVTTVSNRTDDVGLLLGTIIDADRIIAVEDAAERMRREAMLLDAVKEVGDTAATLTGPGTLVLQPSIDFLRNRAAELLDQDHVERAVIDNDGFREAVQDELRRALHDVIVNLELTGPDAELEPHQLAVAQGKVLTELLAAIYAVMARYSRTSFG